MSHSPTPWRLVVTKDHGKHSYQIKGKDLLDRPNIGPEICELNPYTPHAEDNGRLIAAAPDLLEALRTIEKRAWEAQADSTLTEAHRFAMKSLRGYARAAIAKTEAIE